MSIGKVDLWILAIQPRNIIPQLSPSVRYISQQPASVSLFRPVSQKGNRREREREKDSHYTIDQSLKIAPILVVRYSYDIEIQQDPV